MAEAAKIWADTHLIEFAIFAATLLREDILAYRVTVLTPHARIFARSVEFVPRSEIVIPPITFPYKVVLLPAKFGTSIYVAFHGE